MALSRRLPKSNISRSIALEAAKRKLDTVSPANNILSSNSISRLNSLCVLYQNATEARAAALGAQTSSTDAANQNRNNTRTYISHFIQVFNLGVERKKYIAEHRSFYGLGINNNAVPPLTSESDILLWGNNLIKGDPERISAGGAPMDNPDIAELTLVYNKMLLSIDQQSIQKDAYDQAQEALDALNPEADKLILRIWNEIDTAYDDLEAPSRRRKAREWGVIYVSTNSTSSLTGTVINTVDNKPVAQAKVFLTEADISTSTDINGLFMLNTNLVGTATLLVEKIGFASETQTIELEESKNLNIIVFLNEQPPNVVL